MRVVLEVISGPLEGRQIPLQAGEVARFGRSHAADVSFPDDAEMSDVHFEVRRESGGCRLRDLDSSGGTKLNGQIISETVFHNGDEIMAGRTGIVARIEGGSNLGEETSGEHDPSEGVEDLPPQTAVELVAELELEDESIELLTPDQTPSEFVDVLIADEQFADAVRVLAIWLSKRKAVWWAYLCVRNVLGEGLSPTDAAVLEAAHVWVTTPDEEHRRAAMSAAEACQFEGAASWVALAAFWSGGSLAPPDSPEVLPNERLTSQGVTAALMMCVTQGDATKITERYQAMLSTGDEVANGDLVLPEA